MNMTASPITQDDVRLLSPVAESIPQRMQAAVQCAYGDPTLLAVEEVDVPAVPAGALLIRVHAAGLHKGTAHLMSGEPYLVRMMGFGLLRPKQPIPGDEFAGVVVARGEGVSAYEVGERVFGITTGAMAEYAVVDASMVVPMPAELTYEEAASLPISAGAAVHAFDEVKEPLEGASVLILGASGGVGVYAVQIAVNAGAEVTAVCSAAKADFVETLGAHEVLDYRATEVTELPKQYDVILDIAGNRATSAMQRILKPGGTLVYVGGSGGPWFGGIGRAIRGALKSAFTRHHLRMFYSDPNGADLAGLLDRVRSGALRAVVDQEYRLSDTAAAFDALRAGRPCGKLVVTMG